MTVIFWLWTAILAVLVLGFLAITVLMFAPNGALRRRPERDGDD